MNDAALHRLAQLLAGDEPVLLNSDDREIVRAVVAALGASERRAAHLESLLRVHESGLDEIEAAAAAAPPISVGGTTYDYAGAERARETFRTQLDSARDASSIVAAALAFARDAALLAS